MAYIIKYGDLYLHDYRYDDDTLSDVELETEENACGYLDFSIFPNHPLYGKLKKNDYVNPITVFDGDTLLFSGFVYEVNETFELEHQVKCKGEMDYLTHSIVRPFSTYTRGFGEIVNATYADIFPWLIEKHNAQVDDEKRFVVGINQGYVFDDIFMLPNDFSFDDYPTTMDVISEIYIGEDGVGGYLRIRHVNGIRYIDLLYEHTDEQTQILEFGVNLLDYSKAEKTDKMVSAVVPTGAKLKDTLYAFKDGYYVKTESKPRSDVSYFTRALDYIEVPGYELTVDDFTNQSNDTYWIYEKTYDNDGNATYTKTSNYKPIESKTYYINYKGRYKYTEVSVTSFSSGVTYYKYDPTNDEGDTLLTISDLENVVPINDYIKEGDMVYSPYAMGLIGVKIAHLSDTNIKNINDLYNAAVAYLDAYTESRITIEIKAVDLHLINPELKPLAIGEYVRVRSKPHNLNRFFICRNVTLDLNDPSQSTYILGFNYDTLTDFQLKRLAHLEKITNKQIDATDKITDAEKKRSNRDILTLTAVSQEQDAAITSLFEMIIGS